ncbi:MAG: PTS sugar transporter subunit IIA [Balneolaceae bacterium]|nr:MAG: PTS sugar transporter subunit IIA [Balneolaceae bacterium]
MNIHALLDKSVILSGCDAENKEDLLNAMIDVLSPRVTDSQLDEVRTAVFEREKIMSTGVGKNLAIPHGKVSSLQEHLASFAILKQSIDFDSIDGKPVKMAFLLIGPEGKNSTHIKLLSRVSRLMNSSAFREALTQCETADQIHDVFYQEENRYFQ